MRKNCLILLLMLAFGLANAVTYEFTVDPIGWNLRTDNGYPLIMEAGNPALPYVPVRLLVPFGMRVADVVVTKSEARVIATGIMLDHVREPQPVSLPSPDQTLRNTAVWNADLPYPAKDYDYLGSQYYRGYQIALMNVYPWRYNPVSRQILASQEVSISLVLTPDIELARDKAKFITYDDRTLQMLTLMVKNPELASTYRFATAYSDNNPRSRLIDLSNPKKMIIITDSIRAPWFNDYVTWRNAQGISTGVFLTNDIYSEYTGVDNADKVRNFIIDAYHTWANSPIPLQYVILGGDDEVVPERGVFGQVGQYTDLRMPSDLYFSNLDGNWNTNGNNIYGEVADQVDYIPEVHIGRFTAETQIEFDNIFRKTRYYVDNRSYSNNIAIMFGENLNWNPLTWGCDYKDDVAQYIPDNYYLITHYQRDGTYSGSIVFNAIQNGANVMNHMGHANENYLMGQGGSTVQQMTNTEYGFLYSQGCYPAAFDQRTSGDGEAVGEHLGMASGGVFAFIGNTRYGWYMPGSINGPSQYYDRSYFIGMFDNGHTRLGDAFTFSRLDNLNAAMSVPVMRWCYFQMVLFGDPSIEVKFPDAQMPMLELASFSFSDVEGDNDGIINPGETIRLYPRIRNLPGWSTAYNLSISIESPPTGVQPTGNQIIIPELVSGALIPQDHYLRFQLADDIGYGIQYLTLLVDAIHPATQQSIGARRFGVRFDITLLDDRFPWDCYYASKSSPVVYDFDGGGTLDILYVDVFGTGYYIDNQGEDYAGFTTAEPQNLNRSFAMGDITGDGQPDLVFSSRTGLLYAIQTDGSPIFSMDTGTLLLYTPMIADTDGDGSMEIIASGFDNNLYVVSADGISKPGFPLQLNSLARCEPAAADLDVEGTMEIIIGDSDGLLHVIKAGGISLPNFPVQLNGMITGAPTILDNNRIAVGTSTRLYLVDSAGNIVFEKPITGAVAAGMALADMSRNGELDIVFVTGTGNLYSVDQNGNDLPGFPIALNNIFTCPPLIADIDGDFFHEIILQDNQNGIYAFDHNGTVVPGFPFLTSYNGSTPATLVEYDNDGIFKLVTGYSTGVLVINLRKPASNRTPWTTFRGSLLRQGSYASTGYVSNSDPVIPPAATKLHQNYPNPFNPSTTIRYNIAEASPVRLNIYNLKGQKVRTLVNEQRTAGQHSIHWDGTDDGGRTVTAGLYLYRLEAGKTNITRKMLLLK